MVDADRRGDRPGRARLHDRAVVRTRPVRERSTSWRRSPVPPRPAGGRTTPTCATDPTASARPSARRSRRPSGAGSSSTSRTCIRPPTWRPRPPTSCSGMLDDARGRGLDVTFDLTVFQRGGGAWVQSLPAWARDGGQAGTAAVIRDPASRARLVEYLEGPDVDWWMADWDDQLICKVNRPGARRPGRQVDRRDRPRAGPGADGHRARPRPRGRPVLGRADDQEPGPPRSR